MSSYDTEVNYYNKKPLNKEQYYNFYHGNFNFRKIGDISLSQQADITNHIAETNNQTITYVGNNYLDNDKVATVILSTVPFSTDNYVWIPETSDNVVPGLDSILTYTQSKYATLAALQSSITNISNTINNEISNTQTTINNIEITGPQNINKESHYHTSHTDFMYQGNNTNNDNRRQFVIQNHYFTYQRKGNSELAIQALNVIVSGLQTQTNNLSSGGGGDPDGTGTMQFLILFIFILRIYIYIYIYKYVGTNICIYHLTKPCPEKMHPPTKNKHKK